MAKAYGRVEWPFLFAMMQTLGLSEFLCRRIEECISMVFYSILINGSSTGFIQPQWGLWQGDPMSPALLRRRDEMGGLHGIRVSKGGLPISHLFSAEDAVIFCKTSEGEALEGGYECVTNLCGRGRDDFGKYLGLSANFGHSKTAVFKEVREVLNGRINGWAEQYLLWRGKRF
ncbi:hypothetical protein ACFX1X_004740 [Malus domestica]